MRFADLRILKPRLPSPAAVLVCLLAACEIAAAASYRDPEPARRRDRPRFAIETGAILIDGEARIAVEAVVPYSELLFLPADSGFAASFDLIVILYKDGRQVTGDLWEESLWVRDRASSRDESRVFQRMVHLPAEPGKMHVAVTVSERRSGNEGRLEQDVEVHAPPTDELLLGKIWFGRCRPDSTSPDAFLPEEPLVARRFGTAQGPVCVWSRLYGPVGGLPDPVEVEWRVLDGRRETVAEDRFALSLEGGDAPITFRLPVETLWLGGYELRIEGHGAGKSTSRSTAFDMDETVVTLIHNPVESVALVRTIATAEEIEGLENALPVDRQRVWESFWQKRDPTPGTPRNEFKEEFFARVRYANDHFSTLGPGWRTDRGMVYIQYGPPDAIESFPHNIDGPPYEIWTYNALRRRYVFVDYDGFGRYELYAPGRHGS